MFVDCVEGFFTIEDAIRSSIIFVRIGVIQKLRDILTVIFLDFLFQGSVSKLRNALSSFELASHSSILLKQDSFETQLKSRNFWTCCKRGQNKQSIKKLHFFWGGSDAEIKSRFVVKNNSIH